MFACAVICTSSRSTRGHCINCEVNYSIHNVAKNDIYDYFRKVYHVISILFTFCVARNFDKSGSEDDGNHIHTDDNNGKDEHKTQSSQFRKNSGIRITDSIDETEEEDDVKTKNLAKYLGMKDGVPTSIAAQVDI